ncbi:hypothetical protein LEMLEM_LOCUS20620 [Lemmus lemmus]
MELENIILSEAPTTVRFRSFHRLSSHSHCQPAAWGSSTGQVYSALQDESLKVCPQMTHVK